MDMDTIRMPARRSFPNITIPPLRVIAFAVVRIGGHANPPAIGALLDMHDATKNALLRRRFVTGASILYFRHVALAEYFLFFDVAWILVLSCVLDGVAKFVSPC